MTVEYKKIDSSKPTIILVGSGLRSYREYLLKMVAEHANVWLLLDKEPQWETNYLIGFTQVNTLDPIKMKESLPKEVSANGVLCWDEIRIIPSAKLAQSLNLPGGEVESIISCRDKYTTRSLLDKLQVPQAISVLTISLEEAKQAANKIGYPVIVKPRAMAASYGVSKVDNELQLEESYKSAAKATEDNEAYVGEAYQNAKQSDSNAAEHYYRKGVLIEEYLEGSEVSVDSVCVNGKLTPMFLARKLTGFYPYFEEVGHVVNSKDPLLKDKDFLNVLEQAHKAVGFKSGITHTELKLTEEGPKIIEINARLGGDLIPYVGQIASNIDLGKVVVDATCGIPVSITEVEENISAIRFFYPEEDSTVESLQFNSELTHSSVTIAAPLANVGQKLILPPGDNVGCRYGYAIVKGNDVEECIKISQETEQTFVLKTA